MFDMFRIKLPTFKCPYICPYFNVADKMPSLDIPTSRTVHAAYVCCGVDPKMVEPQQ